MESRKLNESLLAAVRRRNRDLVRSLIKDGADPNALDYSRGKTCIDTAVDSSDVELVRLLLRDGASPNLRRNRYVDAPRRSPLIRSVFAGNLEIVRLLINAGALLNVTDQRERNCMHYAAERKSTKVAQVLLKAGVNVPTINAIDQEKNTPLMVAVKRQNVPMVKLLLESGASVFYSGRDYNLRNWDQDVLYEAVKIGNEGIIRLLLEHGSIIAWQTLCVPLDKKSNVSENTRMDIFRILLLHASDYLRTDIYLSKILFIAVLNSENVLAMTLLFENGGIKRHGSKLNSLDPLHRMIGAGDKELLKVLLKQNMFDIEKEDSYNNTPLLMAVIMDNPKMVKMLLKAGANANHVSIIRSRMMSPLVAAISNSSRACLKLLLEAGATYDSAFLYITHKPFKPIMKCILQHVALLNIQGHSIIPEHLSMIENTAPLRAFFNCCCSELQVMQKSIIHDSVTFYSLISDSNIKACADETLVIKALRSTNFFKLFPIYGESVLSCYAKLWGKPRLMEDAAIGLSRIIGLDHYAYHVILDTILRLLPKEDLCNLRLISMT